MSRSAYSQEYHSDMQGFREPQQNKKAHYQQPSHHSQHPYQHQSPSQSPSQHQHQAQHQAQHHHQHQIQHQQSSPSSESQSHSSAYHPAYKSTSQDPAQRYSQNYRPSSTSTSTSSYSPQQHHSQHSQRSSIHQSSQPHSSHQQLNHHSNHHNAQQHHPQQQQQQQQQQQHHHHPQHQQQSQPQPQPQHRQSQQFTSTQSYSPSGHSIPHIQTSDPSFGHRPHSTSYSSTHPQPQYPPPDVPASTSPHPKLHHGISAGHLASTSRSGTGYPAKPVPGTPITGGTGTAAPPAPPKRKDPYATAWRTYSKIAEELNLLNPDGTLYPISKEAILKYLRHQSKRIKSSNLHWYVNGLKKHQENLGIPWDNIRYDDQVVALLKELTLNPVTIDHGDDHSNQWHQQQHQQQLQQQQQHRSRLVASAPIPSTTGSNSLGRAHAHPYASASIDTARIASLSISSPPQRQLPQQPQQQQSRHASAYSPSTTKQYSHHQQQQQQQQHSQIQHRDHSSHIHHQQQQSLQQQQQQQSSDKYSQYPPQRHYQQYTSQSQGTPAKPHHHSAPISVSSPSDMMEPSSPIDGNQKPPHRYRHRSHSHALDQVMQPMATLGPAAELPPSPTAGTVPSSSLPFSPVLISSSINVKRKRHELVSEKSRRVTSPMSPEDEEQSEEGMMMDGERTRQSAEGENTPVSVRSGAGVIGDDGMHSEEEYLNGEDPSQPQTLKRRASTGNLLIQTKGSPVNDAMGSYAQGSGSGGSPHLYQRTSQNDDHTSEDSLAPGHGPRKKPSTGFYRETSQVFSPPESVSSVGSTSPLQRPGSTSSSMSYINYRSSRRPNGVVSSPIVVTSPPLAPVPAVPAVPGTGNKTTVQFSEVVEFAQLLQAQYGGRCRDHPWGCVEISPDHHLELTIKMYMDWAGLVASGRLTMDETPDLPEFRSPDAIASAAANSSKLTTGGTLKRMTSTPAPSFGSLFSTTPLSTGASHGASEGHGSKFKSEDSPRQQHQQQQQHGHFVYRSPSSSPVSSGLGNSPRLGGGGKEESGLFISDSLMSRIGSPPPQRKLPLSPPVHGDPSSPSGKLAASRARKMASSPSLRDHGTFHPQQMQYPPPPLPPLPLTSMPNQYKNEQVGVNDGREGGEGKVSNSHIRGDDDFRPAEELTNVRRGSLSHGQSSKAHDAAGSMSPRSERDLEDEEMGYAEEDENRVDLDAHRHRHRHHHRRPQDVDEHIDRDELEEDQVGEGKNRIDYFEQGEELIKMRIRTLGSEGDFGQYMDHDEDDEERREERKYDGGQSWTPGSVQSAGSTGLMEKRGGDDERDGRSSVENDGQVHEQHQQRLDEQDEMEGDHEASSAMEVEDMEVESKTVVVGDGTRTEKTTSLVTVGLDHDKNVDTRVGAPGMGQ
ncbi:hypothetical protein BGZ94_009477 [Podila epigama]|nr:hypothetical protein BGZ94_009477 [Podila epigama]